MRILMLGNSFTTANHLPELLSRLTGAEVAAHTRGGARLSEQLNPHTRLGSRTQAALREGNWDFVILQEMSNGPITSSQKFRDSTRRLAEQIRTAGAVPVLYATWAYENEARLAALGLSQEEMFRAMHQACARAAEESGLLLADVGQVFRTHCRTEALYAADGVHPSPRGTELAARTLADVLLREKQA